MRTNPSTVWIGYSMYLSSFYCALPSFLADDIFISLYNDNKQFIYKMSPRSLYNSNFAIYIYNHTSCKYYCLFEKLTITIATIHKE